MTVNLDLHPLLPAGPFVAWLKTTFEKAGGDSLQHFARGLGVDAGNLCRIVNDKQATVHVKVVDRALTRAGAHLVDLYPELYPECDFNLFGEMYEVAA